MSVEPVRHFQCRACGLHGFAGAAWSQTHIHTHTHVHTHIHTWFRRSCLKRDSHTYTYTPTHLHTYTPTHIHTYTHTYIHTHAYTYNTPTHARARSRTPILLSSHPPLRSRALPRTPLLILASTSTTSPPTLFRSTTTFLTHPTLIHPLLHRIASTPSQPTHLPPCLSPSLTRRLPLLPPLFQP